MSVEPVYRLPTSQGSLRKAGIPAIDVLRVNINWIIYLAPYAQFKLKSNGTLTVKSRTLYDSWKKMHFESGFKNIQRPRIPNEIRQRVPDGWTINSQGAYSKLGFCCCCDKMGSWISARSDTRRRVVLHRIGQCMREQCRVYKHCTLEMDRMLNW